METIRGALAEMEQFKKGALRAKKIMPVIWTCGVGVMGYLRRNLDSLNSAA